MTNADAEARAKFYGVRATPTALVDGLEPKVGGGPASEAKGYFSGFTRRIESRLDARPAATLTGFTARTSGSTITISGRAEWAPGTAAAAGASVHVALVQDMVRYTGTNGVRFHNLVVRTLLGTPGGTPLPAGTSTPVAHAVDVKALEETLGTYLDTFEKARSRPNAEFKFQDRVARLEPSKLAVVVFVQDDRTKEILQALVVTPER